MALCNIKIYKDSKIIQGKNYMIEDDLKLKEYLNSLQHLNFQIQYQRIELDKTIKINMPQQVQNQGYADDVLPLFNNFNYMEIKNDDYNKSYYYFITAMRQVARQTIEFDLHMDVLNTFKVNIDYSFDDRTRVTREFKDRFKNDTLNIDSQETTIMRDIDIFSEGIQCELFKKSEMTIEKTKSVDETDQSYLNQDFYLIFIRNTSGSRSTPLYIYMCGQNKNLKIYDERTKNEYTFASFSDFEIHVLLNEMEDNIQLILKIPYMINGIDYDSRNKRFTIPQVIINVDNNILTFETLNAGSGKQGALIARYQFGTGGQRLPFEVNASGLFENLMIDLPYLLDDTKEKFLLVEKSKRYESKLLNSDYYYHKISYDADSCMIELQKINKSNLNIFSSKITGLVTNTLHSAMVFKIDDYIDESFNGERFAEDYPNILISQKNNQMTIVTDPYINYLRNGCNYDKKNNEMDSASDIKNLVLNGLQFGAGLALAPVTGGMSAISAISGGIGVVNSIIGVAENQERRNIAMEQKMIQLKNQSVNVRGNSPIDISEFYSKNRLIDFEYSIRKRTKDVLFNLFYYCGYTQSRYGAPKFNQRARFDFIQCEAVFKNVYRISQEIIDELIICYTNGVFYLHYVDSFKNMFNFNYENWENSLLNKLFPPQS